MNVVIRPSKKPIIIKNMLLCSITLCYYLRSKAVFKKNLLRTLKKGKKILKKEFLKSYFMLKKGKQGYSI